MPLPRDTWKTVREDGTGWAELSTYLEAVGNAPPTAKAGHVLVPGEHNKKDSGLLKVVAGVVSEKTQQEIDAADLSTKRSRARVKGKGAAAELAGLRVWRQHLVDQGKATTAVDTRIAVLEARLLEASGDLP